MVTQDVIKKKKKTLQAQNSPLLESLEELEDKSRGPNL